MKRFRWKRERIYLISLERIVSKTFLGDCFEILPTLEDNSVDLILTDPPYLLDSHGGPTGGNFKRKIHDKHFEFISDGFDFETLFPEFQRVLRTMNLIMFCSNKQVSSLMGYWEERGYSTTLLIWHKTNPIPFAEQKHLSDIEFIIWVRESGAFFNNEAHHKMKSKVIRAPTLISGRYHPTQKPEDVIRHLLCMHSQKGDVVLDPFSGSGTLGVCCIEMEREYIQIEMEQEYYEASLKREEDIRKEKEQDEIFKDMFETAEPVEQIRIYAGATSVKETPEKDAFVELFGEIT